MNKRELIDAMAAFDDDAQIILHADNTTINDVASYRDGADGIFDYVTIDIKHVNPLDGPSSNAIVVNLGAVTGDG